MDETLKEYLLSLPLKRVEILLPYLNGKTFNVRFENGISEYGIIGEVIKSMALPLPDAPPGYVWKHEEKHSKSKKNRSWVGVIFGEYTEIIDLTFRLEKKL